MRTHLKAALIGSGMIAGTHLAAMRGNGIDVAGVYSLDTASAVRFAEENGIRAYGSLEELLSDASDLAAICTPSGTHADLAVSLMRSGRSVVVEKPIALTAEDCRRILETERETGRICAPISQLRFSETYGAVKAAVENGAFGRILTASLSMRYWRSPEYYAGTWRGTKAMDGGGALMNQGIHGIDVMCGLLGVPTRISGHVATLCHDIEVEDSAAASLVFPSGALGVIDASTAVRHARPRRLEICGTLASVTIEEDALVSAEGIDLTGGATTANGNWKEPSAFGADLHTAQYRNISAAVRGEEPLRYTARDAANTVRVILAVYESAAAGRTVTPDA